MKYLVVVGDGMADYPIPELGNKTPLQVAYKPNMDRIAREGKNGRLRTVPNSLNPGSDVAILSVLGFNPKQFYTGRGAFEAAARGIQLKDNDIAFRCNLITEKKGVLADYSAGHITSKDSTPLIEAVKEAWWEGVFPGLFITLLVLGFNLIGNGLRDALDPRLRE